MVKVSQVGAVLARLANDSLRCGSGCGQAEIAVICQTD